MSSCVPGTDPATDRDSGQINDPRLGNPTDDSIADRGLLRVPARIPSACTARIAKLEAGLGRIVERPDTWIRATPRTKAATVPGLQIEKAGWHDRKIGSGSAP